MKRFTVAKVTVTNRTSSAGGAELSVVIPSYQRPDLLERCLHSVLAAIAGTELQVEVVVVEDGADERSCELLRNAFPSVVLVALEQNRGYPGAVNAGIARSHGDWVLTLNNDTTVEEDVFDALMAAARADPAVGVAAAQQRFSARRGTIYSAGTVLDERAHATDRLMGAPVSAGEAVPTEVFGACGAAALYSRAMLDRIGPFDERFVFGLEDVDLAWRARMAGWRCLYVPGAIVYHDLGGTVVHGSPWRLFQAGRNRWLLIAKNLDGRTLLRNLPKIVAFDLAYVAYASLRFRTLAPIGGRIAGMRMWSTMRRDGAAQRRPVELSPAAPLRSALVRRRSW
ncbi:MAG: glycosyltransferase family 2 protein [Solirubrobacteraceae bacterium]